MDLPLLDTYQAWKTTLIIWQSMKVSGIQKFQFYNSLVNWDKFGSTVYSKVQKSQHFIPFMNWTKWEVQLVENHQIPNFNIFVHEEKVWSAAYIQKDLNSKIQIFNLRMNWKMIYPNSSFAAKNIVNLHKIKLWTHFKLNIMNETFNVLGF